MTPVAVTAEKEETCLQTGTQSCDQQRVFFFHPLTVQDGRVAECVRKRSLADTSPRGRRRVSSRDGISPQTLCLVSSKSHCREDFPVCYCVVLGHEILRAKPDPLSFLSGVNATNYNKKLCLQPRGPVTGLSKIQVSSFSHHF